MVHWTVDLPNDCLYSENFEAILHPGSFTITTVRWRTDTPERQVRADNLTPEEALALAASAEAALMEYLTRHRASSGR